jgi:hypothetical protein
VILHLPAAPQITNHFFGSLMPSSAPPGRRRDGGLCTGHATLRSGFASARPAGDQCTVEATTDEITSELQEALKS